MYLQTTNFPEYLEMSETTCLQARKWWFFLLSSVLSYLAVLQLLLIWRILRYLSKFIYRQSEPSAQEIEGTFITHVNDWAVKLISAQMLEGLALVLSIISFIIYVIDASNEYVEICSHFRQNVTQQLDLALNTFFLVYFFIRFIAASDKLSFMLELYTFVDFLTIPPTFAGIYLQRTWIGFRCLRVLQFSSISNILKFINFLQTPHLIKLTKRISSFIIVVLSAAGIVHLLENSGDPFEFSNSQRLSYFTCVYFIIVTMTTVGFGDVFCITVLGRTFLTIFLLFGPIIFIGLMVDLFYYQSQKRESTTGEPATVSKGESHEQSFSNADHTDTSKKFTHSNSLVQSGRQPEVQANVVTNAIADFIVTSNLPLEIVEHKGFKHLIQTLIPGFKIPSRDMFATKTIPALSIQYNEKLKADLKSIEYISATSNKWTSSNCNFYISFTVSFISAEWKSESRTLTCRELKTSHTGNNICHLLCDILEEFDIPKEKVFSITSDIGNDFVESVEDIGIRHIPCFAHVIKTFINEIFSMKDVSDTIDKIIMIYSIVNGHEGLKGAQKDIKIVQPKAPLQSECWYKLNQMVYIKLNKNAIYNFLTSHEQGNLSLNTVEHKINEFLINMLRPLEEYARVLADETIPTASLLLLLTTKLKKTIENLEYGEINCSLLFQIKKQFKKFAMKILSVYSELPHLDIAEYFDPRISTNTEKLDLIFTVLKEDYGALKRIKSGLEILFEDQLQVSDNEHSALYAEFVLYKSLNKIPLSEKPLLWWKNKAETFPILSRICKKYLCMQATCTSSENAFRNDSFIETPITSSV